jgi:NAD(P)-dependent dehydrogenase (short-subunit alcohol dehydrogenase family)
VNTGLPFYYPRPLPPHTGDGSGTLINVSSVAGKKGWANATAYCAFKFGLTDFTEALAADVHL